MIISILLIYVFIGILHFGNFEFLNNNSEFSNDSVLNAKHILVEDSETAREIINVIDLNGTGVFCDLVKKHSLDFATSDRCGSIGDFEYDDMETKFSDAVLELEPEEYTVKPVKTSYGYHIILRVK